MKDLIYRLLDFINNHKTKDTNYFIALFLLKDVYQIASMNITVLAESCYTSPAAVTRFCKRIGYSSFQEFKEMAKIEHITIPTDVQMDVSLPAIEKGNILQHKLYHKMVDWLDSVESNIQVSEAQHILKLINESEKVSFFGTQLSQAIAQDFQYRLAKLGKFVQAFSDIQEQLADALELDEHSVAIVTSPSGRFVEDNSDLMRVLRTCQAKVFVLTHNEDISSYSNWEIIRLQGRSYDRTGFSSERFSLMYFFDFAIAYYQQLYPLE
ncbi:MurR/RpiR family transcriptional regulator [Bacillus sp. B1-b2]|uniref:MurR/RpiR family transcriptional regulator n=1 Tax=Bacillus sp. B1-b2 TaxID=2653201 RepID=UPI0012621972|nr:MurR/RpiR family transcriptional regulator [Bacillus sp. B1-b2]KAB7665187.1 MurR/RpiR family transcriptional regulator [Bacillus sp. B1-b2]